MRKREKKLLFCPRLIFFGNKIDRMVSGNHILVLECLFYFFGNKIHKISSEDHHFTLKFCVFLWLNIYNFDVKKWFQLKILLIKDGEIKKNIPDPKSGILNKKNTLKISEIQEQKEIYNKRSVRKILRVINNCA